MQQQCLAPAMSAEGAESSRACQEPEPSDEARQRRWVVLAAIPVVLGARDERGLRILPGVTDFLLQLQNPPRPTHLLLPKRLAPDPKFTDALLTLPYIVATDPSGRLLFYATRCKGPLHPAYFLCDAHAHAHTATRLPDVPAPLFFVLRRRRNIGLIADPHRRGHYMVAQLHPTSSSRHDTLLYYSTATDQWAIKTLASAPDHELWGAHGVFAHDGLLWWVDIAYGMLVCDPFHDHPSLRFVPLPVGCEILDQAFSRISIDERRCIRPSQGKLRYVEIRGLSYHPAALNEPLDSPTVWMWTLVDPEGPHPWEFEYEAPFADIWADDTYIAAGLPPNKVPKLALVDPNNHGVVYFFQGSSLFALDVRARRVLACEECFIDRDYDPELKLQYSRYVHAWELPPPQPTLLGGDPSSDGGSGSKGCDEDQELDHRRLMESVASWLDKLELSQPDEELSLGELMSRTLGDMAPPSESSPDAGEQADEP